MSGKYLLDTCFIIGLQNRNTDAIEILKQKSVTLQECAYSVITRLELLSFPNLSLIDEAALNTLLGGMLCLNLSDVIQSETIKIRRRRKVKLPDAMILATAKAHSLELLTLDQKLNELSLL